MLDEKSVSSRYISPEMTTLDVCHSDCFAVVRLLGLLPRCHSQMVRRLQDYSLPPAFIHSEGYGETDSASTDGAAIL